MRSYVIRRLLQLPVTILIASVVMFMILRLIPGDMVTVLYSEFGLGGAGALARQQEMVLRQELGLDRPIYEQYYEWLRHLLTGDFGDSFWLNRPAIEVLKQRIAPTMEIMLFGMAVGTTIGVGVGIIAAVRQDTWLDYCARSTVVAGLSMPSFVSGVLLLIILAYGFNWLPSARYLSLTQDPVEHLKIIIWPSLLVGFHMAAGVARLTRTQMLEVIREDYIRTAWAKGLPERLVILRHTLRNALLPVLTLLGLYVANLISGAVVLESLFNVPGMGSGLLRSTQLRDYAVLQLFVIVMLFYVLIVNLLVDLMYAWVDPRIRLQ